LLKYFHIRNFAVIEELEIQFDAGMTVFTGETGAGKSIIVDALGLVLGDRADSSIIRSGSDNTEITAIFDIGDDQTIPPILNDQDILYEDELMLRRVVNRDGRSRAYANGSPVTAQLLRELGECMVDIHGQHEHQSLLKREVQRTLLDEFGQHQEVLERVRKFHAAWSGAKVELDRLSGGNQDRSARLALLEYQVRELEALNPVQSEIAALEEEHMRLANASRLLDTCRQAIDCLSEDEQALLSQLNHHIHELQDLSRFDHRLSSVIEMLDSASIQISEAAGELRRYLDGLDLDPGRLRIVEERISTLHDIARKHKVRPGELAGQLEILKRELDQLKNSEQRITELQEIISRTLDDYRQAAQDLHKCRMKAAKKLGRDIQNKLAELGMPGGRFVINIEALENDNPSRDGMDHIEFQVAINPGQAMLPLSRVASGGELSRISLAIQVIGNRDKGPPTLIFDEVDAGIGGGVAEIVGKLLHSLAANRQVLCVTHLPQVASQGDHHLLVEKSTYMETTLTRALTLDRDERIEEIARMLGGLKITDKSRAHAKEMLRATSH
jgi:DNA repair protein RecN (Recombination protein N)